MVDFCIIVSYTKLRIKTTLFDIVGSRSNRKVVSSRIYRATQDTLVVVGITCGLGSVMYCRHTGCISLKKQLIRCGVMENCSVPAQRTVNGSSVLQARPILSCNRNRSHDLK